jgi:hypothetical protein
LIDVELAPETFVGPAHSPRSPCASALPSTGQPPDQATLAECGNVKRKAAEILGISLKTLYNGWSPIRQRT